MELPDEVDLASSIAQLLRQRGLTLSVAESCTGGLVSHRITDVPGSSVYYHGSVTSYSNEIKKRVLGVRHETLAQHGVVSKETALEMAQGVRNLLGADIGLAVTGIAGPDGGTPEKPVGLVYIALAAPDGACAERKLWAGKDGASRSRAENKALSAEAVLDLLERYLQDLLW